jgi:hypothetical protein
VILPMANFTEGNILDRLDDLEAPSMVKIYTKIIRRKYKRRYLYAYSKYLVPVSARYNKLVIAFLETPLEEKIYILGETMLLTLTRRKSEGPQNGRK